jgi:hypothetical protein
MAILIKSMSLPESCKACPLNDWNCDPPLCVAVPRYRSVDMWSDKRADWCPLIEVKRPRYDAALLRDCGMEE